jgi:hypothetical protein
MLFHKFLDKFLEKLLILFYYFFTKHFNDTKLHEFDGQWKNLKASKILVINDVTIFSVVDIKDIIRCYVVNKAC